MNTVKIILEGIDNASPVIKGVEGALGGLADIAGGALKIGLAAGVAGLTALGAGLAYSVSQAMEAQEGQASLAAVLKSVGSAATEQAAEFEAAQGKLVTVGEITGAALEKLQDNYRLTEIAIAEQQSKMDAIAASSGTANTEYEKQAIKLKDLKGALAGYATELAGASGRQVDMAGALGLTAPILQVTLDQANALAMQFRDLAGGSDDAILAIEEIGIRAGTIAADEMPKFIQTVLDLGEVMGDTAGAATILARAQEDPIAAMGRLQRSGIIFSATLKEQIKQLVKTGDSAGAAALLLGRVGEATSGAAQASADTFAGKLEIMQGHLAEIAETVGNAVLPILEKLFTNFLEPALPWVEAVGNAFAKFFTDIDSGRDPVMSFANLIYTFAQNLGLGQDAAKGLFTAIASLKDPLESIVGFVASLASGDFSALTDLFPTELINVVKAIADAIKNDDPAALFAALDVLGGWILEWAGGIWTNYIEPEIPKVIEGLTTWIGEQTDAITTELNKWGEAFANWISPKIEDTKADLAKYMDGVTADFPNQTIKITNATADWGTALLQWVEPQTEPTLAKLGDYAGVIASWLVEEGVRLTALTVSWGRSLWEWIDTDAIPGTNGALGRLNAEYTDFFVNDLLPGVLEFGKHFISSFISGLEMNAPLIKVQLNKIKDDIKATWDGFNEMFVTLGNSLVSNISLGISQKVSQLIGQVTRMVKDALDAAGTALGTAMGGAAVSGGGAGKGPGGASGLDMIVPSGYPNDTFPLRASSGERVTIAPQGEAGGGAAITGGGDQHITILLGEGVLYDGIIREGRARGEIMVTAG